MMPAETIEKPGSDYVIDQGFGRYTAEEHEIWRTLFHRQAEILKERAAPEFLGGLAGLGIAAAGIP
jgi:phenylalanine-4-hydroxylase